MAEAADFRGLALRALDQARADRASYADVRVMRQETQSLVVKNGVVQGLSRNTNQGFGVRVLAGGSWGFASSAGCEPAEIDRAARLAVQIAHASRAVSNREVWLAPTMAHVASYTTPLARDPFEVPLDEKIALLLAANEEMRRVPGITVAEGSLEIIRTEKLFASSEGAIIAQTLYESGAGIEATATREDEVQSRAYPNSFGRQMGTGGWELIAGLGLADHGQRIAEEAVALLDAPVCPSGVTTLILDSSQLALQLHESCGHAIELDRVLGSEASFAGTSFLTPEKLGSFHYGSELVNVTADPTSPGGLGTFGFDDEGIPATPTPIVREGVFVGYLTSRETASELGLASNGCMRADGWNRIPLIRMTNINLEPGEWSLEEMIADTDKGVYLQTNKSWSIDDRRLNFQFVTQIGWEIKRGKLGRMLRNSTYQGITPEFWGSCDAVGSTREWRMWGTPNCGKGEPMQEAHVGHGTPPARFRNVRVGV